MIDLIAVATQNIPAQFLFQVWQDEAGQDLIEYALIAAFIGLATVTGVHGLAAAMADDLESVVRGFDGALAGHV